jgi:hypothetical protein
MDTLNEVLAHSSMVVPPLRDIDGIVTQARMRRVPNMHQHVSETETSLPAPEQWLLTRHDEMQLAELIERHIDYIDDDGQSVHLAMAYVRHYLQRHDNVLPTVVAIATLPIVLPDGAILAQQEGFDRDRGIVFHIPHKMMQVLPDRRDCTPSAVKQAIEFLTDDWLVDVATDYAGKCILLADAMTIIERSLLPDRPAFFVSAGRRGGGKTTALAMVIMSATGQRPAAAAWSPNDEERRKALMAYYLEGVPYIVWDNIPRGTQISCPHIEKSCTSAYYTDRRLGVSERVATSASTIHLFTGNNIGPRGDLASRSLQVRLEIERPDPENRSFRHPDPVTWTEHHRGAILQALYTIMLGNPMLGEPADAEARTRFKMWWRIVGAAVEHAASLAGHPLDFCELFLSGEEDDEDAASLAAALDVMANKWPMPFKASDVADLANDRLDTAGMILRDFLIPNAPPAFLATAKSVGRRLKAHVGEPVQSGGRTLILKVRPVRAHELTYFVTVK